MMEALQSTKIPPLWIDTPDVLDRIASARSADLSKQVARDLAQNGLAVIKRANPPELCAQVVEDYERYVSTNRSYVDASRDELGREKRLVNFHLWSDAAARIGTNPRTMEALDFVFGMTACVYTSLTFKYGTQQPVHRDSPHFATWPRNYFVGVWTALEPIHPAAGPLFYHPGAHRFRVNEGDFMREAASRRPDATAVDQCLLALDLYNGEVIRRAPQISAPKLLELETGDTVIWHPELPHGGSPAADPNGTRWSIVFHCAPDAVQVHQHQAYFSHKSTEPPAPRYGFREFSGRKVALSGEVAYM
jgi:ectoine hydroxylase-related dioxygenase (phytanoyl-CoA dioxygenase family)